MLVCFCSIAQSFLPKTVPMYCCFLFIMSVCFMSWLFNMKMNKMDEERKRTSGVAKLRATARLMDVTLDVAMAKVMYEEVANSGVDIANEVRGHCGW